MTSGESAKRGTPNMTLVKVDSIWLSKSADTDCQACGMRYFAECDKCKKIVCTWCAFAAEGKPPEGPDPRATFVCKDCNQPQERNRTT